MTRAVSAQGDFVGGPGSDPQDLSVAAAMMPLCLRSHLLTQCR